MLNESFISTLQQFTDQQAKDGSSRTPRRLVCGRHTRGEDALLHSKGKRIFRIIMFSGVS
jgi:hypothetical protein